MLGSSLINAGVARSIEQLICILASGFKFLSNFSTPFLR
jgi:hypothetical protein